VAKTIKRNFWGALVKELRDLRGITQHEFAAENGVTRSIVRRVETGVCRDIRVIDHLLDALGYDLDAVQRGRSFGRNHTPHGVIGERRSILAVQRLLAPPE
jgi:transcriptional regulator with XRE-family HTH domain